jgi:hypothetical protein
MRRLTPPVDWCYNPAHRLGSCRFWWHAGNGMPAFLFNLIPNEQRFYARSQAAFLLASLALNAPAQVSVLPFRPGAIGASIAPGVSIGLFPFGWSFGGGGRQTAAAGYLGGTR